MLSNKLKEIRMREYMFSQKEFASFLGVQEPQYYRYEAGRTQPSLELAIRISNLLSKNIEEIWTITKSDSPHAQSQCPQLE